MTYQNIEIEMYWYVLGTYLYIPFYDPEVCTWYILFPSSTYSKSNILDRFNLIHTSTYSRKKVCTENILRVKSMNQVQTGLCPFISVPYYSMVHTGMYRYVLGTYHSSRFQMNDMILVSDTIAGFHKFQLMT